MRRLLGTTLALSLALSTACDDNASHGQDATPPLDTSLDGGEEDHDGRIDGDQDADGEDGSAVDDDATEPTDATDPADATDVMDATESTDSAEPSDVIAYPDAGSDGEVDAGSDAGDASFPAFTEISQDGCTIWDSFPPTTDFKLLRATTGGFAIADGFQVYERKAGAWTLWLRAGTETAQNRLTNLVAGATWLGAVRGGQTVLRASAPPLASIGTFPNISATAGYGDRLWIGTTAGAVKVHDGTNWSDVGTTAGAVVAMAASQQGLIALTASSVYVQDSSGFRAIAVPAGTFTSAVSTAAGDMFVLGGSTVYRYTAGSLTAETVGCVAEAVYGGVNALLRCNGALRARTGLNQWDVVGNKFIDESIGALSLAADETLVVGTQSRLESVKQGLWTELPRVTGPLPFKANALAGKQGSVAMIGGPGGIVRHTANGGFELVAGSQGVAVQSLWEQSDSRLFASSLAATQSCSVNSECQTPNSVCSGGTCVSTWFGSGPGACELNGPVVCPQGMACGKYPNNIGSACYQKLEISEMAAGARNLLYSVAPFSQPLNFYGDNQGQLYVPMAALQMRNSLIFFDGTTWQQSTALSCSNATLGRSAFVAPNIIVGACTDQTLRDVVIGSTTTSTLGQGSVVAQLASPYEAFVLDPSPLQYRVRETGGYVPASMPLIGGTIIGGTRTRLVAIASSDAQTQLNFQVDGVVQTRTVPFHEVVPRNSHSTDGWQTFYATVRAGALMRCSL